MYAPFRRRFALLCAAAALCLLAAGAAPVLSAQVTYEFNLPEQSLADALRAIGRQTALNILFDPETVENIRVPALRADLTAGEAIDRVLAGTKLQAQRTTANSILVQPLVAEDGAKSSSVLQGQDGGRSAAHTGLMRVASSDAGAVAQQTNAAGAAAESRTPRAGADDRSEIIVTGSHIRGDAPAGSKVMVLDRQEILDTGYASLVDVLRDIPQNYGTGLTEISGAAGNFTRGTGFNLRGFGNGSTLTLINGRRPSASGDLGDYSDINSVPVAAIERIEILADGASAIYGSDAIAGVVNIILRKDYQGAETQARYASSPGYEDTSASQILGAHWSGGGVMAGYQYYRKGALRSIDRDYAAADKRSFGGRDFRNNFSNPGNISIGGVSYAIPSNQNGTALTPASFTANTTNLHERDPGVVLIPGHKLNSAFFEIRQQAGAALDLALEGRISRRETRYASDGDIAVLSVPNTNAFYVNPTGGNGTLSITYNMIDDMGLRRFETESDTLMTALSATHSFAGSWRAVATQSYGREKYESVGHNVYDRVRLAAALADSSRATAFNPFADGSNTNPATLAAIRTQQVNKGKTDLLETALVVDGPLFAIPGGEVRTALGGSYRDEGLRSTVGGNTYGRSVAAVFGELTVPLVGTNNARPGLRALELSLAGRYDRYNDVGSTTNPKFGVRYAPWESLTLRSTWGTSFKAPKLYDLDDVSAVPAGASLVSVVDPLSTAPSGQSVILLLSGNNRDLRPETADSWSAGFDFTPAALPGLLFSATYYDMDYQDRIVSPGPASFTAILVQEAIWYEIITRGPTSTQLAAACALVRVGSCTATPPAAIVDQRLRNIARLRQRGIDVDAQQLLRTDFGNLTLGVHATYILSNEQQVSAASPLVDIVGTALNPTDLRLRGMSSWNRGNWGADLSVNYTDKSLDNLNLPNRNIGSWTTFDAGLSYRMAAGSGWYGATTLALRAVNILDEDPPFVNFFAGFDQSNTNALGRLVSLHVTKEW